MAGKYLAFGLILPICMLSLSLTWCEEAKASLPPGRSVLLTVSGLSWQDLQEGPLVLRRQVEQSFLAAVNINTAERRSALHNYVTLGAGGRAKGLANINGFNAAEEWEGIRGDVMVLQRMGWLPSPGEVVVPRYAELRRANEQEPRYGAVPGRLGEAIRSAGLKAAVFGNADVVEEPLRLAPLITMDEQGRTAYGDVGEDALRAAPERPYGVASHYAYFLQRFDQLPPEVGLIVFDLGDLARLDALGREMDAAYRTVVRQQVLVELSQFVETLQERLSPGDALFLFSSEVGADETIGIPLTPLVSFPVSNGKGTGPDDGEGGVLLSGSTKRAGLVTNADISTTILTHMGVKPPQAFVGQQIRQVKGEGEQATFWQELFRWDRVYQLRAKVLKPYAVCQIALLLLSFIVWMLKWRFLFPIVRHLLLALMAAPFFFLVLPGWLLANPYVYLLLFFVCALGTGFLLQRFLPTGRLFFVLGLVSWLAVFLDVWRGSPWMQHSFLGYDPAIGARYYGIGNEYLGVVIGSTSLSAAMLLGNYQHREKGRRTGVLQVVILLLFISSVLFFAWPRLGTNAGGALAAAVGYAAFFVTLYRDALRRKKVPALAGAALLGLLFLLALNWHSPTASHIGQAIEALRQGEFEQIGRMVYRKLEMNWRLIRISSWSKVLVTSLIITLGLFLWPSRGMRRWASGQPALFAGFGGIAAGSVAALLFNDSGVVAAATAIIFLVVPLLYLQFVEEPPPVG